MHGWGRADRKLKQALQPRIGDNQERMERPGRIHRCKRCGARTADGFFVSARDFLCDRCLGMPPRPAKGATRREHDAVAEATAWLRAQDLARERWGTEGEILRAGLARAFAHQLVENALRSVEGEVDPQDFEAENARLWNSVPDDLVDAVMRYAQMSHPTLRTKPENVLIEGLLSDWLSTKYKGQHRKV